MSESSVKVENINEVTVESFVDNEDQPLEQIDFSVSCDDLALMEDKSFLIDLVNKSDPRLTFVTKDGKSQAWIRYQKIYYKSMETNFVKCIYCNDIKKHNKYLGTAAMLRHQCIKNSQFQEDYQIRDNIQDSNTEDISGPDLVEFTEHYYNDKQFLQSLIDSGDNRLSFEPQVGKSEVWNRFERVLFNDNETLYVKCKACNDLHKQTRFLGTTSLLRHRCQNQRTVDRNLRKKRRNPKKKIILKNVNNESKCQTIEEKIRIENKTLKTIIKKCLEMIEKCLCIKSNIVNEKKHINVLINKYNEWLLRNQELEESEDNSQLTDIFDNQMGSEEFILGIEDNSDYESTNQMKNKSNINKSVNKKNSLVFASDLVKKKYIKSKTKGSFPCDYPECGRTFNNSYNLMQHRNKHNPNKYRCDWYVFSH